MDNPVNYMKYIPYMDNPVNYMKYPYMDNPVNYMKYPYMDNPVNYMKYIPLHGQPCKLYEIHTLTWTTL